LIADFAIASNWARQLSRTIPDDTNRVPHPDNIGPDHEISNDQDWKREQEADVRSDVLKKWLSYTSGKRSTA
jgi:hypothetical protein